jgi:hypothetical protein
MRRHHGVRPSDMRLLRSRTLPECLTRWAASGGGGFFVHPADPRARRNCRTRLIRSLPC